ncbi:VOC family protein [Shouchella sp. 1P09AA]|uniref:VOC family protein n=1 Tax=unclassified Shouchella TaxID=2893065 RepID=UPI0039A10FAB
MKITGIHHISLVVSDIERARAFYGSTIQLREVVRPPFDFAGAWYALGPQQLHLIEDKHGSRQNDEIKTRGRHVAFYVENVDQVIEFLQQRDIPYLDKKFSISGFHQIFMNDPDGNTIEFMSEID